MHACMRLCMSILMHDCCTLVGSLKKWWGYLCSIGAFHTQLGLLNVPQVLACTRLLPLRASGVDESHLTDSHPMTTCWAADTVSCLSQTWM